MHPRRTRNCGACIIYAVNREGTIRQGKLLPTVALPTRKHNGYRCWSSSPYLVINISEFSHSRCCQLWQSIVPQQYRRLQGSESAVMHPNIRWRSQYKAHDRATLSIASNEHIMVYHSLTLLLSLLSVLAVQVTAFDLSRADNVCLFRCHSL